MLRAAKHAVLTAYHRRELIFELIYREVKLRYRGSVLGFAWTLLNPLIFMLIYTLVFSVFFRLSIPNYPAFLLSGMLAWSWFGEGITMGSNTLIGHAGFLKNAVFPAEILPWVAVGNAMVNFLFSLPILFILLFYYNISPSWSLLALPFLMAVQLVFTTGIVFYTSIYLVFFRDLQHLIGHALMALFFLSPIMYDASVIPVSFRFLLTVNPIAILIQSYRNIFLYQTWPDWERIGLLVLLTFVVFISGAKLFLKKKEETAELL